MTEAIESPKKKRLNFEVPENVREKLSQLVERSGASSFTEVVKKSLALYDLILELQDEGGHVLFKHKDGTEERIRIL